MSVVALGLAQESSTFPIQFRDVTKEAGLYDDLAGIMGHGGAWGDFDGLIDLFVGGTSYSRPTNETSAGSRGYSFLNPYHVA